MNDFDFDEMKKNQSIAKEKKLVLFNGRGYRSGEHLYIAAKNRSDAARMLCLVYPHVSFNQWIREIKDYFSKDCWGVSMNGIEPCRGIWIEKNADNSSHKIEVLYAGTV